MPGERVRHRCNREPEDFDAAIVTARLDERPGDGFASHRVFYVQFLPAAPLALQQEVNRIIIDRFSEAVARVDAAGLFDAEQSPLARQLSVPTQVLHAQRDQFCSYEDWQCLAAPIPGAQFVGVDSKHSLPLAHAHDGPATMSRVDAFPGAGGAPRVHPLTERQREVLRRVAQDHTDKAIARSLSRSGSATARSRFMRPAACWHSTAATAPERLRGRAPAAGAT